LDSWDNLEQQQTSPVPHSKQQEARLSQTDCFMLCVIEYIAKSLEVIRNETLSQGMLNELVLFMRYLG